MAERGPSAIKLALKYDA